MKNFKITIKQKPQNLPNSVLDVPKKQIYFGFQYINESSVKFVQNLISKYFNLIKCIPYFKKGRNLLSYVLPKIKEFDRDTSTGVYRIPCDDCSQCYIGETKRALTLKLRGHQANCRNQNQHSVVVDHSAIGHSWGFNRAKIINTKRNTIKRKIAESLFISRARKIVTKFHNYSYEIVMSPVIVNSYKNGHNSYQIVK